MRYPVIVSSITFTLFLLLPSPTTLAQGALQPDWVLRRAGTVPNFNAEAWGVDADAKGTVYWGTSESQPGLFEGLDGLLYKLSPDGAELWTKPTVVQGGQFTQQIYATSVSGDTVYVAGRTCGNNSVNLEMCDMLIAAIDARTGDTLWTRTWGRGHGYEEADWVAVKDDGLYIGGWSDGGATDWDAGLIHLGFDGSLIWSNAWGTEGTDHQDGHIVVDDSVIYGGGLYNGGRNALIILKGFDGRAMLAKWRRSDGGYINHVAFGRDDSWTNLENSLGLASYGTFLYVVGNTTVGPTDNQMFIRKYDKNLNLIWERLWGGEVTETSRALVAAPDGALYVAASTSTYGAGDFDAAIVKYSADGDFLGYKTWGGAKDDQAFDIALHGSTLYVTGKTSSFSAGGSSEGFLFAVGTDRIAGVDEPRDDSHRDAAPALRGTFPDPFTGSTSITFTLPRPAHVRLTLHDLLGRELAAIRSEPMEQGWHTVEIDGSALPSGTYLCRLVADGSSASAIVTKR